MFNPMMMGLSALAGATNPEAFAAAAASSGKSPTDMMAMGGGDLGSYLLPGLAKAAAPVQAQAAATDALPPGAGVAVDPAAAAAPNPLAGLGAVKAPEPVRPIMNAGVSGAQKAPEVRAMGGTPGGASAALQMLMNGGGNPLRVPDLGALLKGMR